jgi:hypothetical protein
MRAEGRGEGLGAKAIKENQWKKGGGIKGTHTRGCADGKAGNWFGEIGSSAVAANVRRDGYSTSSFPPLLLLLLLLRHPHPLFLLLLLLLLAPPSPVPRYHSLVSLSLSLAFLRKRRRCIITSRLSLYILHSLPNLNL